MLGNISKESLLWRFEDRLYNCGVGIMGGLCSKKFCGFCWRSTAANNSVREGNFPSSVVNQIRNEFSKMENHLNPPSVIPSMRKDEEEIVTEDFSFEEDPRIPANKIPDDLNSPRKPWMSSMPPYSSQTKSVADQLPGKGKEANDMLVFVGGKPVPTLDTIDSNLTNFSCSTSFNGGVNTISDNISILAFEVANTIVRGSKLMKSLAQENMIHLNEVVLRSEGVQLLISNDMDELLRIVAADKREELKLFSGEVVRFGNRCKDSRWHNLDKCFDKLEYEIKPAEKFKEAAYTIMQQLMGIVQYTAELYQKMQALDKLEQDHQRLIQDDNASQRDNLQQLMQELKIQRKHVKVLRRKSLWSETLEKVVEKLADVVQYLHIQIREAFESGDQAKPAEGLTSSHQRLGSAGLALHYANVIIQINALASRSSTVPKSVRDMFYQSLPSNTKSALRTKLQSFHVNEQLSVSEIKSEMDKTLCWLVPVASNTVKAQQGFGWVGEWANTGSELNRKPVGQMDPNRIETFYHASKEKIEFYILELVAWLHHLTSHTISTDRSSRSSIKSPTRPLTQSTSTSASSAIFSKDDRDLLRDAFFRRIPPGISKSLELQIADTNSLTESTFTRSYSYSSTNENVYGLLQR